MKNIRFSIITVVLNPVPTDLLTTINSVLKQDFSNWELIIKDGSLSNDIQCFIPNDVRIKYIMTRDDSIYDAMNQGIAIAEGQYINFLNSGDTLYCDDVLSKLDRFIGDTEDVIFYYGDVSKAESRRGFEFYPDTLSRYFLFSNMVCHQAWFVKSDYYQSGNFYDTILKFHSDYYFFLKMLNVDKVNYKHMDEVLVRYLGGGISQSEKAKLEYESDYWKTEVINKNFKFKQRVYFAIRLKLYNSVKVVLYDYCFYLVYRKLARYNIK